MDRKNMDVVHDCVTEQSYPLMTDGLRFSTLRWQFIKSLEPPRVVHARCTDVVTKENVFAQVDLYFHLCPPSFHLQSWTSILLQVTVRFHTQQTLAIYDRFGRLIHGSEIVAKDVLEYVVFEKHIANQYGKWRIHEKIIPDWMPPPAVGMRTYVKKMPVSDSVSTKLNPASSNSV